MARMIVLRFDATCFDCGSPIPAGATARWFGRGRVSCCGTDKGRPTPLRTHPADDAARAPSSALPPLEPSSTPPQHVDVPPYIPSAELQQLANATGITIAALASGLGASDVAILAARAPRQRLLVRLQSGARFIVPAEHCAHVVRCIEESLVDRCRDVALLAEQRS